MLPLNRFLNPNDRLAYPTGCKYTSLFPDVGLPDKIKDAIVDYYYDTPTSEPNPQSWLRRFHLVVKTRATAWIAWVESEEIPVPDNGRYNYDMTEEETSESTGNNSSTASATNEQETTTGNKGYTSDTPEGQITDIERFMSSASTADSTTATDGTTTSTSDSNSAGSSSRTLTRRGNIGVMTASQILMGYREMYAFKPFDVIFAELAPLFIEVWGECDEGGYFYHEY